VVVGSFLHMLTTWWPLLIDFGRYMDHLSIKLARLLHLLTFLVLVGYQEQAGLGLGDGDWGVPGQVGEGGTGWF
jgi:hypothetical protein